MDYAPFRLKEWQAVQKRALTRFRTEVLGDRPTFKEVKKDLPNPFHITALEWAAIFVLIALFVVTSFKAGAVAVPFADSMITSLLGEAPSDFIRDTFRISMIVLFVLMATPALIYFKLLDKDPQIVENKLETRSTPWYMRWSLDYISPRLPYFITYATAVWLVIISSKGDGTLFEKYLPVVLEVGLAHLVGVIISKRAYFNGLVYEALKERQTPYDFRWKQFSHDRDYLQILYQEMKDAFIKLTRPSPDPKLRYPNAQYEYSERLHDMIVAEYWRMTADDNFANSVSQGEAPVAAGATELRKPKHGSEWSAEGLLHDIKVAGLDPTTLSESTLALHYAPGHGARKAWREAKKVGMIS